MKLSVQNTAICTQNLSMQYRNMSTSPRTYREPRKTFSLATYFRQSDAFDLEDGVNAPLSAHPFPFEILTEEKASHLET